jgi:dihydrofolate reductase
VRPLLLDLTTSLDGHIADRDEGIDRIQPPSADASAEYPADYFELMDSVDALVMGRATYELSLRIPGGTDVFAGKRVHVVTSRADLEPREGVDFVNGDPVAFIGSSSSGRVARSGSSAAGSSLRRSAPPD